MTQKEVRKYIATMVFGDIYKVTYGTGPNTTSEFAGAFLGHAENDDQMMFDLRPLAGTQTLPVDWIKDIQTANCKRLPKPVRPPKNDGPEGLKNMLRFR